MSGKDENPSSSYVYCYCNESNKKYWICKNDFGGVIARLNSVEYVKENNKIGLQRVNIQKMLGVKITLEQLLFRLSYFFCSHCGRRISKNSVNGEILVAYICNNWSSRSFWNIGETYVR